MSVMLSLKISKGKLRILACTLCIEICGTCVYITVCEKDNASVVARVFFLGIYSTLHNRGIKNFIVILLHDFHSKTNFLLCKGKVSICDLILKPYP